MTSRRLTPWKTSEEPDPGRDEQQPHSDQKRIPRVPIEAGRSRSDEQLAMATGCVRVL